MLLAALRDMQWRKRRFVIAILSTSIIFAMTKRRFRHCMSRSAAISMSARLPMPKQSRAEFGYDLPVTNVPTRVATAVSLVGGSRGWRHRRTRNLLAIQCRCDEFSPLEL